MACRQDAADLLAAEIARERDRSVQDVDAASGDGLVGAGNVTLGGQSDTDRHPETRISNALCQPVEVDIGGIKIGELDQIEAGLAGVRQRAFEVGLRRARRPYERVDSS